VRMKMIELRRHTDNDGDQLSAEGVVAARDIGGRLRGPYALFVSTGAARATQTLEIWREAVGQTDASVVVEPGLRSAVEDRWRAAAKQAGGSDLDQIRSVDPELVSGEALTLGAALRRVLDQLPDGGRALVVGHSPTNEAAVLGLTGEVVAPIGKGHGVLVAVENGGYRVEPLG
jgi:phosphohistidine phosphatase SixA